TDLVGGQSSPIILSLRPQQPPTFTLGAGSFNDDGTINDPLLTLNMPALEIDFYAMVDQRFSRMFTVRTDVALGIGLQLNAQGQITPVIGDTTNAFTNVTVTNSDMLLSQDGFWLQGKHTILVRARAAGQPETTDDTPVELTAIIDSIAPTVALTDEGNAIRIEAEDRVSAADDLVVDYRFGDGE